MTKATDLSGTTFGRLTVLNRAPSNADGKARWFCRCECGNTTPVYASCLIKGMTRSCGCVRKELTGAKLRTHGQSKTSEYRIWKMMRRRCTCADAKDFHHYGGRGIVVCERWQDFANFYADMGPRPSKRHSIDRIDNDGDYCPENCRWATLTQQRNNTRQNVVLVHDGQSMTVAQWAERIGVEASTLNRRIKLGWNASRALTEPLRKWPNQCHE